MSCWDCFATWTGQLIPQKFMYLCCPCARPSALEIKRMSPLQEWQAAGEFIAKDGRSAHRLKLLTYNTQQLIHFADTPTARRIAELVARNDYDVVCLTEVFDEVARDAIADELAKSKKYTVAITRAGSERWCGLGEDSGLFLASKFPIVSARFQRFRGMPTASDALANKGILLTALQVGAHTVLIASTHLQAHKDGAAVRDMQLLETLYEVKRERETLRRRDISVSAVLLCGDLNITDVSGAEDAGFRGEKNPFGDTSEYQTLLGYYNTSFPSAKDCFRHFHPDSKKEPGYTFDALASTCAVFSQAAKEKMRSKEIPPEQERLDYIWLLDSSPSVRCTCCAVDRCGDLSDHFGLYAEFTFQHAQAPTRTASLAPYSLPT